MLIDQGEMIVLIYVLATPLDGTLICRSDNTTQLILVGTLLMEEHFIFSLQGQK